MCAVHGVKYDMVCTYRISCVYCIVTYVRDPDRFRGSHYLSFRGTVLHLRARAVCLLHFGFCSDSQSGWCLFSWSSPGSEIWGLEQSGSSPYRWWSLKWLPGLDIEVYLCLFMFIYTII